MRTFTKTLVAVSASAALVATGTACSSSATKPAANVPKLTGVSTSVKLDSGFLSDLTALKLTPGLVGKATMPTPGTLTFPITGGHVKVYPKGKVTPYVQGSIEHNGSGLTLTGGGTVVTLENFVIDPGNNSKLTGDVLANGKSVVKGADLFTLDGSTLQPITVNSSTGVATLTGTKVEVSAAAAKLLDSTFKTTAVKAGLLVGVATILANTK